MTRAKELLNMLLDEQDDVVTEPTTGASQPTYVSWKTVNKDITPVDYLKLSNNTLPVSSIRHKMINSVFNIHKSAGGKYLLFHLMFDQGEFDAGYLDHKRANNIVFIGGFNTMDQAKRYLTSLEFKKKYDTKTRQVLSPQLPYTKQEIGLEN